MGIYLIKHKTKGEFIDNAGRLESEIDFSLPVYHMTMKYAQRRIESLNEPNNYEVVESEFVSLIMPVKQDKWEDIDHYRYVYNRWLKEEDIRKKNETVEIMVETLKNYEEEVWRHYNTQGIDPIFTIKDKSDEKILNLEQVMELCKELEVIPKPLTFIDDKPVWSSLQIEDLLLEQEQRNYELPE